MPTFCRHNRFAENCPICAKKERVISPARSAPRRASKPAGSPARKPARGTAGGMVVRRLARAEDDGYEHDLVPGLRASDDARRLAAELAFAQARVEELSASPPGLYAEVAGDEEGAWLAFLIAYLSPLEGAEDPFASVRAVRVPWATGELPEVSSDVLVGPRTGHVPSRGDRSLVAYRQWAARAGGQLPALHGDATWSAQRRFDRAFERLSFLPRSARYEFLVLCGRLGLADMSPSTLHLSAATATEPIALAAKRVFGIGDVPNLARRSADLVAETETSYAALDLALQNWMRAPGERITAAATVVDDAVAAARVASVLAVSLDPDHG